MAFFALGATQLAVAAGSRVRPGTLANPSLLAAVAAALLLQFAGLYLPVLLDLLKTQPLPPTDLRPAPGQATRQLPPTRHGPAHVPESCPLRGGDRQAPLPDRPPVQLD